MHMRRIVIEEMHIQLLDPFTGLDLFDALHDLLRDNFPREDGFLPSFYMCYGELLGSSLIQTFHKGMESRRLLVSM